MTHEELVRSIKARIRNWHPRETRFARPLLAVVELHKPHILLGWNDEEFELCERCFFYDTTQQAYPCETIQAIEKELK